MFILGILEQFGIEDYTWGLDIVQILFKLWQFFFSDFLGLKFANTLSPKIPQRAKYPNTQSSILLGLKNIRVNYYKTVA